MRSEREIRGIISLYLVLVVSLLYFTFRDWAYDDPFITFRYARNVCSGMGFVYNLGERVLSTTTPLYALLLAGLSYIWCDLPSLSNLISAFSLALGGVFLYLIGKRWKETGAGLTAAVLFPFFPLMVNTFGAETCFYVMLILGAFTLYAGEQYYGAMVLAALATLTRSDGILVGIVLIVDFLITHRRIPWRPVFLFALLVAPWYLFSWVYFGSPFPATLAAKQHQGQMAISESFARGFLRLLKGYARYPFYWLHGILALLGIGYAFFRDRRWLILISWGMLYFVSYVILGVTRYFWYYATLVPVIIVTVGLGVAVVQRWFSFASFPGWLTVALLVFLLLFLLWPQGKGLWYLHRYPDSRVDIYREVGMWLSENTDAEASVGTLEVGIIGYYARRRMIGFAGLIQPDVAQQLSQEATYQDAAIWAVETYQPDYLVLNPQGFTTLMGQYVDRNCEERKSFVGDAYGYKGEIVIYECQWMSDSQGTPRSGS